MHQKKLTPATACGGAECCSEARAILCPGRVLGNPLRLDAFALGIGVDPFSPGPLWRGALVSRRRPVQGGGGGYEAGAIGDTTPDSSNSERERDGRERERDKETLFFFFGGAAASTTGPNIVTPRRQRARRHLRLHDLTDPSFDSAFFRAPAHRRRVPIQHRPSSSSSFSSSSSSASSPDDYDSYSSSSSALFLPLLPPSDPE